MNEKDGLFDVTMGTCDDAEICELLGTFLLDKISEKYDKNSIGLYREDALSVSESKSGTHLERINKRLQKTFKDFDLEIVGKFNLTIVNDLDVALNLSDGFFKPYDKLNDVIQYINKEYNHPPNLIKHLTASIQNSFQTTLPKKKIVKESTI